MTNEKLIQKVIKIQLNDCSQLPDIHSDDIIITFTMVKGELTEIPVDIHLIYNDIVCWREPSFFEDPGRFREICNILSEKYGNKLADVVVDEKECSVWLYGDNLKGPSIVNRARKKIRRRYFKKKNRGITIK